MYLNVLIDILVVDDTAILRRAVKTLLVNEFNVKEDRIHEAHDSRSAVAAYTRILPECVLMDINMPGDDGIDVVKEIRAIDPDANIIMCTSSKKKQDVIASAKAGATGYIMKPPTRGQMEKLLKKLEEEYPEKFTHASFEYEADELEEDDEELDY